ncbi:MAG: proline dehydrogenase family protein [Flavisolibacter sp.]
MNNPISFDNTSIAFAHQTDKELKQSRWLFSIMGQLWLVKLGSKITPWAIKSGLPVKGLIRHTIFKQFVGGETLEQTLFVAEKLGKFGVGVILDFGVEGRSGEKNYDHARNEFIRVIQFAATQPKIPFMSVKVTSMARFELLEKIDGLMKYGQGSLIDNYQNALTQLNQQEAWEWSQVLLRIEMICKAALKAGIGFLLDAEESWIQDPIDALAMNAMVVYNKNKVVVYNTIQLYRHDRLGFLKTSFSTSEEKGFVLGVKLVRGAYMEKERKRAIENNYASPIQLDKKATDCDYDQAISFCILNIDKIATIIASHNEKSNLMATELLKCRLLSLNHKHIHFSQLFGMSDNITFNLAEAGCSVSKYLPFGPIKEVIPYLIRRAQENTAVGGQTSRELNLIEKELKRRKH